LKATLVARAHAMAADTGAEVFLFVAGPSGRSWQYATPLLAAAAAAETAAAPTDGLGGGGRGADAQPVPPRPLLTLNGVPGGDGGALAASLRRAAHAATGHLPPGLLPHTETMPDPPGVPDLLARDGGGGGTRAAAPLPPRPAVSGGGARPAPAPAPPAPPPPHVPWRGGAALTTDAQGRPLLTLAPRGG